MLNLQTLIIILYINMLHYENTSDNTDIFL